MGITNEQKKKLAAEFMMEGDAQAAAEVHTIYRAFCNRSDVDTGAEAVLTLLAVWLPRHALS